VTPEDQDSLEKSPDDAQPVNRSAEEHAPAENQAGPTDVDDFFNRLRGNLRWPKPDAAAVAAAVEAVQRVSSVVGGTERRKVDRSEGQQKESSKNNNLRTGEPRTEEQSSESEKFCPGCGAAVRADLRFCGQCGSSLEIADIPGGVSGAESQFSPAARGASQHHYHHHYHHFFRGENAPSSASAVSEPTSAPAAPRGRAPGSPGISLGGKA
jgi:hypothetical protein